MGASSSPAEETLSDLGKPAVDRNGSPGAGGFRAWAGRGSPNRPTRLGETSVIRIGVNPVASRRDRINTPAPGVRRIGKIPRTSCPRAIRGTRGTLRSRETGGETVPAELFQRYRVVDVDTHLTEPPDLWTSRVSTRWGDAVPHVENVRGTDLWMADDNFLNSPGNTAIAGWPGYVPDGPEPTMRSRRRPMTPGSPLAHGRRGHLCPGALPERRWFRIGVLPQAR